eukprot:TRINITY_DN13273_c0_g1_i1.p1 TRINITY_DN13273_c0_g1~~TRINITY_DN13273_c0_g1_i1.p1  ORF type:complete len:170 (+),score=23.27 TRINITY_DN13273_c0_g1_i1:70-579(+)
MQLSPINSSSPKQPTNHNTFHALPPLRELIRDLPISTSPVPSPSPTSTPISTTTTSVGSSAPTSIFTSPLSSLDILAEASTRNLETSTPAKKKIRKQLDLVSPAPAQHPKSATKKANGHTIDLSFLQSPDFINSLSLFSEASCDHLLQVYDRFNNTEQAQLLRPSIDTK